MEHRAVEYLELSGAMETAKRTIARSFDKMELDELNDTERAKLKNAVLTRYIDRFKEGAAKIVEATFPSEVLDQAVNFLKSDTGRKVVFYGMMTETRMGDLPTRRSRRWSTSLLRKMRKRGGSAGRRRERGAKRRRGRSDGVD